MGLTYKESGVDVDGASRFVSRIAPIVKNTFSSRVLTGIGGFGALFNGSFPEMEEPVLVSGTDGVGTKLKIAQTMGIHDTVGIDAVAMCVNDIVTMGAQPLFFLDYISCGKLEEDTMVALVSGLAKGCEMAGASLIGGETAEHPGVMDEKDYDIAGFTVGVVDKKNIITGETITPEDVIIGIPSSGIHSNGFSMVRKLFFELKGYDYSTMLEEYNAPLGKVLLTPTKIYVKPLLSLIKTVQIKGLVHITGGGFYENIPRILPKGTSAVIESQKIPELPIFSRIAREGDVSPKEMFSTFNMGIGMIVITPKEETSKTIEILQNEGEEPVIIGSISSGEKERVRIV